MAPVMFSSGLIQSFALMQSWTDLLNHEAAANVYSVRNIIQVSPVI